MTLNEFIEELLKLQKEDRGYDVSDVNAVNKILDDMIEEIKNQNLNKI